jgi:hypothetical protein
MNQKYFSDPAHLQNPCPFQERTQKIQMARMLTLRITDFENLSPIGISNSNALSFAIKLNAQVVLVHQGQGFANPGFFFNSTECQNIYRHFVAVARLKKLYVCFRLFTHKQTCKKGLSVMQQLQNMKRITRSTRN